MWFARAGFPPGTRAKQRASGAQPRAAVGRLSFCLLVLTLIPAGWQLGPAL